MNYRKVERNQKSKEKGITLITLVITIVVLIILATVSIGVLGGENGIIKKSKYAKEQTEIAEEMDILKISTALAMGEDAQGNVTETNLRNELDKNIKNYTIESKADKFKVTFESGRAYIVDVNGNVSEYYDGWEDIEVTNPKVIFSYNGATGGNSQTIDTSTFTFGGWYKENIFKTEITENTPVTTTSNHTLYAKWNQNPITTYTVAYNQNTTDIVGNMPTNQTKTQGVNLKLSDLVPTRAGYLFNGWSTNISQTEAGEYQPGATFSLDTNVTLYAVWKKAGTSSIEIANNAVNYYGRIVEGYNAKYDEIGDNNWRLFMADNDNIYLIAEDYIHYNYSPSKNGVKSLYKIESSNNYKLIFNNAYSEYVGSVDINNEMGNKWLSTYWTLGDNSTSKNSNMKYVACMLDTTIWNEKYKQGYENMVDYVIGGPTIEMYCKSYKDTHPTRYIQCTYADINGYQMKWSDGYYENTLSNVPQNEYYKIYINSDVSKSESMLIASPSSYETTYILYATSAGKILYFQYTFNGYDPGFKPIVCLKKGIQLEKNETTGNYRIIQ